MTPYERFAIRAIRADATFATCAMLQIIREESQNIASLSLMAYFSLYLYESRRALPALALPTVPQEDVDAVVAAARHSLKFFEDTKRRVAGQQQKFDRDILPEHADVFLDNTWFPPARFLETDLGLYLLKDGRLFSTTHAISFMIGVPPGALKNRTISDYVLTVSAALSGAMHALSTEAEVDADTVDIIHDDALKFVDRRSKRIYASSFTGKYSRTLNANLSAHLALVALVTEGITVTGHDFAWFKLRFITAYQVTASLKKLQNDQSFQLSGGTQARLKAMIDNPEAITLLSRPYRQLRNLFIHYLPAPSQDSTSINSDPIESALRLSGITNAVASVDTQT